MDRRTMIKGAGATLAVAMSARSYARIKGANDRLRVAVVGVNGRGQAHMSAFSKLPNVDVTHFCDVDSAVLAKRAGEFAAKGHAAPKIEGDYRRLFDSKAVDIVTVATPDHWHAKLAIDAMKSGHHVYCEKPIGIAPAEGEADRRPSELPCRLLPEHPRHVRRGARGLRCRAACPGRAAAVAVRMPDLY